MPMTASELRSAAERITWFHSMDLGGGVPTDGSYDPTRTLGDSACPIASMASALPARLARWAVRLP